MKNFIEKWWDNSLIAPIVAVLGLGSMVLPDGTAILTLCFVAFMVSGLWAFAVATKAILEKKE